MHALALLGLLLNATVWGLSWWPFRLLQQHGLGALAATAFSYGSGALLLGLLRPRSWAELRRWPQLAWIGLASGITNACFNVAITRGDVVRVVLLFYLMPVWTALLARPLLGERMDRRALGRLLLALAGALIVLWPHGTGLPWPRGMADWLSLIGGIAFACTNLLLRRWAGAPTDTRALAMFVGGGLVPLLLLPLGGGLAGLTGTAWWLPLLGLALALVIANLGLQFGAAALPAAVTAVVMTVEIPVAAVSAWMFGAAAFSTQTWLGGSLILAATLLAARRADAPQDHHR